MTSPLTNSARTGKEITRSDESRQNVGKSDGEGPVIASGHKPGRSGGIYFDLDGVLRDLTAGISNHRGYPYDPQSWNEFCGRGLTLCEYIDLHKSILLDAPPTEYLPVISERYPITILTCQPLPWIPYTRFWIEKHIPAATVRWCCQPEEKIEIIEREDGLLLEDYPFFENNERIIMIDRPYNRMVEGCHARVTTPDELKEFLKGGNQ